jgi:hypothetical protein
MRHQEKGSAGNDHQSEGNHEDNSVGSRVLPSKITVCQEEKVDRIQGRETVPGKDAGEDANPEPSGQFPTRPIDGRHVVSCQMRFCPDKALSCLLKDLPRSRECHSMER